MDRAEFFRVHKRAIFAFRMEYHFAPVLVLLFSYLYARFRNMANRGVFAVLIAINRRFIKRDGPALAAVLAARAPDAGKICDQLWLGNTDLFHRRILK